MSDLFILKEHFKEIENKRKTCREKFSVGTNFIGQVFVLSDLFNFPHTSPSSHLLLAF